MTNFDDLQNLAAAVATTGLSAVPHARIRALATDAVSHGASPVLASVMTDPSAPEVARARAFGRVTTAFVRADDHGLTPAA